MGTKPKPNGSASHAPPQPPGPSHPLPPLERGMEGPAGAPSRLERQTLEYHELPKPGKTEVVSSKRVVTQHDLSLAYTPGVAIPCLKIQKDLDLAYRWTNKGNLVAVVTN